jgi:hypothetical protein
MANLTEKQHTNRSSELPIEEVYTNNNVNMQLYHDPTYGYSFEFPPRFSAAISSNKVIGIRRLEVIPTSHVFNMYIRMYRDLFTDDIVFENEWFDVDMDFNYRSRPLNWREGIFYSGYIFPENPKGMFGDDDSTIEWIHGNGVYHCTYNGFVYQYEYNCTYNNPNYEVKLRYRRSNEIVKINWFQMHQFVAILEENSVEEILCQIINKFNEMAKANNLPQELTYNYNNRKCVL